MYKTSRILRRSYCFVPEIFVPVREQIVTFDIVTLKFIILFLLLVTSCC